MQIIQYIPSSSVHVRHICKIFIYHPNLPTCRYIKHDEVKYWPFQNTFYAYYLVQSYIQHLSTWGYKFTVGNHISQGL